MVHLVQPAAVYAGQPSDLKHITMNSYIGVGSVKGADGKEHATDIKIFPDVFRGLAEGSYMQPGQSGAPSNSRMTNGAVAASSKPKSGSRMTNGAVTNAGSGSELTVGGQQIDVPAGTPVVLIARTGQPLQAGQHVLIPAKKQGDGSLARRISSCSLRSKHFQFAQLRTCPGLSVPVEEAHDVRHCTVDVHYRF